jgi:hypothetical protein
MEQGQSHEVHADPRHLVDDRCRLVEDGSIAANGAAIREHVPRDPAADDGLIMNDPEPVPQRHASVGGMRRADQVDAAMNHRLVLEEQVASMTDVLQHMQAVLDSPVFKDLPPPDPREMLHPSDVIVDKTKVLGRGTHSVVYAGTLCGLIDVAVKVLRLVDEDASETILDEFCRTKALARHCNVVHVFGIVDLDDCTVGVVMEQLGAPLLRARVDDPTVLMKYTVDIIAGMKHIHSTDHVGDFLLQPAHILLTQDSCSAKIVNFGVGCSAFEMVPRSVRACDDLPFMAPEVFAEEWQPSPACDVYSFAVVVAELWTGSIAWEGTPPQLVPCLVAAGHRPFSADELKAKGVPAPIIALIVACWAQDPRSRPTFAQLVDRPSTPA